MSIKVIGLYMPEREYDLSHLKVEDLGLDEYEVQMGRVSSEAIDFLWRSYREAEARRLYHADHPGILGTILKVKDTQTLAEFESTRPE